MNGEEYSDEFEEEDDSPVYVTVTLTSAEAEALMRAGSPTHEEGPARVDSIPGWVLAPSA
jgi:hypothetical protein